jgi:hypothetical protein
MKRKPPSCGICGELTFHGNCPKDGGDGHKCQAVGCTATKGGLKKPFLAPLQKGGEFVTLCNRHFYEAHRVGPEPNLEEAKNGTKELEEGELDPDEELDSDQLNPAKRFKDKEVVEIFTCLSCGEFFEGKNVVCCADGHSSCKDCQVNFFEHRVLLLGLPFDSCSGHNFGSGPCKKNVDEKIGNFIPPELSGQYVFNNMAATDKSVPCPGTNCRAFFEVDGLKSGLFTCSHCETTFCINCLKIGGHPGNLCEEVHQEDFSDFKVKPCPRCKALIQRKDGCNHLTCRCGHHFCDSCGKSMETQDRPNDHFGVGKCAKSNPKSN